jgi:phosphoribosyl-ATP pyrophosphohydrolase
MSTKIISAKNYKRDKIFSEICDLIYYKLYNPEDGLLKLNAEQISCEYGGLLIT